MSLTSMTNSMCQCGERKDALHRIRRLLQIKSRQHAAFLGQNTALNPPPQSAAGPPSPEPRRRVNAAG